MHIDPCAKGFQKQSTTITILAWGQSPFCRQAMHIIPFVPSAVMVVVVVGNGGIDMRKGVCVCVCFGLRSAGYFSIVGW